MRARRVLVATDHHHSPAAALEHGAALAGPTGEVVLACVLVVPLAQPLEANMERAVGEACAVLEAGERESSAASLDTRLVRARSFAAGVLDTLAAEPFDLLVLEKARGAGRDGMAEQIGEIMERADAAVAVIRPR